MPDRFKAGDDVEILYHNRPEMRAAVVEAVLGDGDVYGVRRQDGRYVEALESELGPALPPPERRTADDWERVDGVGNAGQYGYTLVEVDGTVGGEPGGVPTRQLRLRFDGPDGLRQEELVTYYVDGLAHAAEQLVRDRHMLREVVRFYNSGGGRSELHALMNCVFTARGKLPDCARPGRLVAMADATDNCTQTFWQLPGGCYLRTLDYPYGQRGNCTDVLTETDGRQILVEAGVLPDAREAAEVAASAAAVPAQ